MADEHIKCKAQHHAKMQNTMTTTVTTTATTTATTPVIEPVIVDFVGKTIQSDPKVLSRKSSGDVGGGDGREPDRQIRLNDGVRNRRQCAWPIGERRVRVGY